MLYNGGGKLFFKWTHGQKETGVKTWLSTPVYFRKKLKYFNFVLLYLMSKSIILLLK